jgi:GT2 family glycosyltransferase
MHLRSKPKVVLLGMMTKMPVAGVVWQNMHYLVGFERLGCEVYYVEQHARTPSMFMDTEADDGSGKAAAFISKTLRRFDLADRWAFHALHEDGRCYGMSETRLRNLYASADLIINLHGGTTPLPEHYATGRLVYLETDPVQLQIELHDGLQSSLDFLEPHCAFFTFGENLGSPDCGLPTPARFHFKPTRQPVVCDFWETPQHDPGEAFTSIGNWQQHWRTISFRGETYTWSKHHEFLKFIDLPSRTPQPLELALSSCEPAEQQMLEAKGWHVRNGLAVSLDPDVYRDYIASSRGEFTVAKDQNIRLRSGWFSDRAATYLAAGRPVITQETGFSNHLPTGAGLLGFSTMEEIVASLDAVNGDYEKHSRAAHEIAREFFNYDVVLGRILDELGVSTRAVAAATARPLPSHLPLTPVSRRPIKLPEITERTVLNRPVPAFVTRRDAAGFDASIVVVTHDGLVFTRMCLESILANPGNANAEIVIVDNASADGTPDYLRSLAARNPQVRAIFNERNEGFARANNQGLATASGHVLVLLNNDTIVAPGWLDRLIAHLRDGAIGLAGPVTNRIGNEAEIETHYRSYGEMLELVRSTAQAHAGQHFDIPTPCMFCLALRRDVLEQLGPLDEQFEVGLLEDDDYALRARAAGFRLICAEDVFVHHFGEASFGNLVPTGEYERVLRANQQRFEAKWGRPWQPYARRHNGAYEDLKQRIRGIVGEVTPAGATVLVVSKGDDELLALDGRAAWHFPRTADGTYAGCYPADAAAAIAHLEELRAAGADFLIVPAPSIWWLDHYSGFKSHLLSCYAETVHRPDICMVYSLRSLVTGSDHLGLP